MAGVKKETLIVRSILQWLATSGGDGYHVHGSSIQRAGEPDIDGWIAADDTYVHLKVEVKTEQGKPTPLQLFRLRRYGAAGYYVAVVTSVEEFIDFTLVIKQHLRYNDDSYKKARDFYRGDIYGLYPEK